MASSSVPWCTKPAQLNRMSTGAGVERRLGDVGRVQHVQLGGVDAVGGDLVHQRLVHVGGDDARALRGEGQRGGAADALAGGGDEGGLVGKADRSCDLLLEWSGPGLRR